MIALFRSDDRLTPPAWLWHATCGQQVIRPRDMVLLSGPY